MQMCFSAHDAKLRLSAILGGIRGKKSLGGGTTKLQGGNHHGKKRGLRVYDGQRVPLGTLLAKQFRLDVLLGWNVSRMFVPMRSLIPSEVVSECSKGQYM